MTILVEQPWLAGIVAAGFLLLWRVQRHGIIAAAAATWAAYMMYEYLMHWRILCTGECNIRVDLLLIHPVLGILSLVALFHVLKRRVEPG